MTLREVCEKYPEEGYMDQGEEAMHFFNAGRKEARAEMMRGRRVMSDWQPMETAPKDGSVKMLLYCPQRGVQAHGRWDDDRDSKRPRPYWTHDGEYLWGSRDTRTDQPTHWMPMPDPPKETTP